jgi:hypothetical protein
VTLIRIGQRSCGGLWGQGMTWLSVVGRSLSGRGKWDPNPHNLRSADFDARHPAHDVQQNAHSVRRRRLIKYSLQGPQRPGCDANSVALPKAVEVYIRDALQSLPDQGHTLIGNDGGLIPCTHDALDTRHPGDGRAESRVEIHAGKE